MSASASSSILVMVRARPLNALELSQSAPGSNALKSNICVTMSEKVTVISDPFNVGSQNEFQFDHCFWSAEGENSESAPGSPKCASQETVYNVIGPRMLTSIMDGYNSCLFTYGQTGSGKTYSIMGDGTDGGSIVTPGIAPRLCEQLFGAIDADIAVEGNSKVSYSIQCTFCEVYCEKIRDLLAPATGIPLRIRHDPNEGPFIEGLTAHNVAKGEQALKLLTRGLRERVTAETRMNISSSRSHAIFTLHLQRVTLGTVVAAKIEKKTRTSKIHLVDLAGSERVGQSGAVGDRFDEARNINLSLTTLGRVIDALVERQTNMKVVPPYRESALTHLLSDSLGGNSKTMILATISPSRTNYAESLGTLRYANKARSIVNIATVNADVGNDAALIEKLREQIAQLQKKKDPAMSKIAEARVSQLEKDLVSSRERVEALLESEALLKEEKQKVRRVTVMLSETKLESKKSMEGLTAQLTASKNEVQRLQSATAESASTLKLKNTEIERLKKQLAQANADNDFLREEVNSLNKLKRSWDESAMERKSASGQLKDTKDALAILSRDLERCRRERDDALATASQAKSDVDRLRLKEKSLQESLAHSQHQERELHSSAHATQQQLRTLEGHRRSLEQEIRLSSSRSPSPSGSPSGAAGHSAAVDSLMSEVVMLREDNTSLRDKTFELQDELEALREDHATLQCALEESHRVANELDSIVLEEMDAALRHERFSLHLCSVFDDVTAFNRVARQIASCGVKGLQDVESQEYSGRLGILFEYITVSLSMVARDRQWIAAVVEREQFKAREALARVEDAESTTAMQVLKLEKVIAAMEVEHVREVDVWKGRVARTSNTVAELRKETQTASDKYMRCRNELDEANICLRDAQLAIQELRSGVDVDDSFCSTVNTTSPAETDITPLPTPMRRRASVFGQQGQAETAMLRSKVQQLEQLLEEKSRQMREERECSAKERDAFMKALDDRSQGLVEIAEDRNRARVELDDHREYVGSIEADRASLREDLLRAEMRCAKLQDEIDSLQLDNDRMHESAELLEVVRDDLRRQLDRAMDEIEEANGDAEAQREAQRQHWEAKLELVETSMKAVLQKHSTTETALHAEINALEERISVLNRGRSIAVKELEESRMHCQEIIDEKQSQIAELESTIELLQKRCDSLGAAATRRRQSVYKSAPPTPDVSPSNQSAHVDPTTPPTLPSSPPHTPPKPRDRDGGDDFSPQAQGWSGGTNIRVDRARKEQEATFAQRQGMVRLNEVFMAESAEQQKRMTAVLKQVETVAEHANKPENKERVRRMSVATPPSSLTTTPTVSTERGNTSKQ